MADKQKHELLGFWRPTESWVRVHLRRFGEHGIRWDVRRRGDLLKGTVLLTMREAEDAWSIFMQISTPEGDVQWLPAHVSAPMPRARMETYLDEATARDPDLWIIETEEQVIAGISGR